MVLEPTETSPKMLPGHSARVRAQRGAAKKLVPAPELGPKDTEPFTARQPAARDIKSNGQLGVSGLPFLRFPDPLDQGPFSLFFL